MRIHDEAALIVAFKEADAWIAEYAPDLWHPEMTCDEIGAACTVIWNRLQPAVEKIVAWFNENLPAWRELTREAAT